MIAWKFENKLEHDNRNTDHYYPNFPYAFCNPLNNRIIDSLTHPEITKHQSLSERYCKLLPASHVLILMYLPVSEDLHDIAPVMFSGQVFWSGEVERASDRNSSLDQAQFKLDLKIRKILRSCDRPVYHYVKLARTWNSVFECTLQNRAEFS